jgi:hypothetical protein
VKVKFCDGTYLFIVSTAQLERNERQVHGEKKYSKSNAGGSSFAVVAKSYNTNADKTVTAEPLAAGEERAVKC